jgi:hypothetical protein
MCCEKVTADTQDTYFSREIKKQKQKGHIAIEVERVPIESTSIQEVTELIPRHFPGTSLQ